MSQALDDAAGRRDDAERDLYAFLSIPSISALPQHRADVLAAADWVADFLSKSGMHVELDKTEGLPVVAADWLKRPGKPTLALYGHYDVQPPDPLDSWVTPPFEPHVREGFVYARGATDDKGQLLACMEAVKYVLAADDAPINLRLFIEGEEEIGGPSLGNYLRRNRDRLTTDYVFIADGLFATPQVPKLVTCLRGAICFEIDAKGAATDLHSGLYGGVAPNPLNTLAHVISKLKTPDGRVTVPGFYDRIDAPSDAERVSWSQANMSREVLLSEMGANELEGIADALPVERIWALPTFDVHGIVGGFVDAGHKTVIPAKATAKASFRLVPNQDPDAVINALQAYVPTLATPGVEVSVRILTKNPAIVLNTKHPGTAAAAKAFKAIFGYEPILGREGGSVPVALDLQRALNAGMIVSGFGLPGDGLHSPNERFSLSQFHGGIAMVIQLVSEIAAHHYGRPAH